MFITTVCVIFLNELNSFVTMAPYWVPDTPILKAFLATFNVPFSYLKWCLVHMIQQAYKYVSSSSAFSELKIANTLKSSGWGLEKS